MARHGTVSRKLAKTKYRKPTRPKHRDPAKAARRRGSSTVDLEKQLDLRTRELNEAQKKLNARTRQLSEALEQQTATSEVLQIISSSPAELEPVFEHMLENAVRICGATYGTLLTYEKGAFRRAAQCNAPETLLDAWQKNPVIRPLANSPLDRIAKTKEIIHVIDAMAEPVSGRLAPLAGARTLLNVPMLRENKLLGIISIYRTEVRPFTHKQIALVQNFAAHAVIAIENTRLLSELRQRTDDLSEALEQQTATSEVLRVISSSPGELEPVFRSMLENAVRICEAQFGTLFRLEGDVFHPVAGVGIPATWAELQKQRAPSRPKSGTILDRVLQTRKLAHTADYAAEPSPGNAAKLGGARSTVAVPMLKDDDLVGAIIIYRQEVRPFTAKQIELVQNFAAQAVIAIENTRLLNELRQRTDDLSEALEQQTATSEVLQIISGLPGELEPVFQAMLANATRICEAVFGNLYLCEADAFRMVAAHHDSPAYVEARMRNPLLRPPPDAPLGRLAITKQVVQVADIRTLPSRDHPFVAPGVKAGYRTVLAIPLLKDDELIGAFTLIRGEVRTFTGKQIGLLTNFATQAVIAIENTRLLNELRESLQQQTATADVLKVISRSPGELTPVFDAMLQNAVRICEAKFGVMFRFDGDVAHAVAMLNLPPALDEYLRQRGHR